MTARGIVAALAGLIAAGLMAAGAAGPGAQAAVLYQGDRVLGGGWIVRAELSRAAA